MAKLTKGTQIYFIDPDDDSVVEVVGVVSLNPGGDPADEIETTTLTDEAKTFMRGMRTPGNATMEINTDPTNASHLRLHALSRDDDVEFVKWAIGWSDGSDVPTVDSDVEFVLGSGRTWFEFNGYIADFPLDFATNNVVKTSVSVKRTGACTLTKATT